MIGKMTRQAELFIPGDIGDFVPPDNILKRVDKILNLSWLEAEVAHLYCADNGRTSIAPEAAVRLMLAGFFSGITQDRKLMREAQVNLAIRWFAGYNLGDTLPHHSSLTRIRQRWGEATFRRIFTRTVAACADAGLVGADTIHIDATLIRADVSWESLTDKWADTTLAQNNPDTFPTPPPETPGGGKTKKKRNKNHGRPRTRQKRPKKRSRTDPDCSLTTSKKTFRMEPSYKQHTAVDDQTGIIVDVEVTTGETSEGNRLPHTIDRVEANINTTVERITADGGYAHSANYAALEARNIDAVIPPQKTPRPKKNFPASRFKYDAKHNIVHCPAGQKITRHSPFKNGVLFRASAHLCGPCSHRAGCMPATAKARTIFIAHGHEALLRARRRRTRWDADTINWYKRHRWRVEGVHGEAKQQHGLHRAARRGMANVAIQAYLTAAAINLKRLAASLRHALRHSNAYLIVPIALFRYFCGFFEYLFVSDYQFRKVQITGKLAA